MNFFTNKKTLLFLILGSFFVTNALIAEFIGVKLFSLEESLGITPFDMKIFGQSGLSFNLTAGVLLWPVVFIITDIINEYFGRRGVRLLSFLAAGLIAYAFFAVTLSIRLPGADFWILRDTADGQINMDHAYNAIFGQGAWIIIGSLIAFLLGQFLDAFVFYKVKKITGDKHIWLRATGSTVISQFIDSFVVLLIAFYLGPAHWAFGLVLAIGLVNYMFKLSAAIILTPVIYLLHYLIDSYLGTELALKMKLAAMGEKEN
ncbi:MAG: queuosine precursor transporter [Bacteroidetes bacterium]|nr:queuosine precursor transporter [Bacteroidota bacterium]